MKTVAASLRGGLLTPAVTLACLVLPLLLFFLSHGYSSGDDLPFHLGSWQDAAQQLRHGVYPQWDAAAAYGTGEPRFVFYPPLSWLLGASLSTFATSAHAAEWFITLTICGCWIAMYLAARRWASISASLLAATVYAAAPYMLFNGLQRAAFGELLAAAWLPLLFAGCTAPAPRVAALAVPLALLWLTNIPTAILGSYLLLLVALFRLLLLLRQRTPARHMAQQAAVFAGGTGLGLGLTSFFLLPALVQAKDVQLATAFQHGLSFHDNFLLRHTAATSRQTLHTITVMVAAYVCVLLCILIAIVALRRRDRDHTESAAPGHLLTLLAVLACLLLFLMLPPSAPVWQHLPKLAVLQFPWRLLSLLTLVLAYAVAVLVNRLCVRPWHAVVASVVLGAALVSLESRMYWRDPQQLEAHGLQRADVAAATQPRPTQEYTPAGADNTGLQQIAATSCSEPANIDMGAAYPSQLRIHLLQPATCTLPLRNYARWTVLTNGAAASLVPRSDGRMALQLPAGTSQVEVRWHRGWDYVAGLTASLVAFLVLMALLLLPSYRRAYP